MSKLPTATRTILSLQVVLVCATLACASLSPRDDHVSVRPHGPGFVHPTIEAAAVDGLAYSYEIANESGRPGLMHGGTIYAVSGGYTYDEIASATPQEPLRLVYELRRRDVAQFRTYPRTDSPRQNRMNERPSRADRRNVDVVDPRHRPLFILTPKFMVRAYRGDRGSVDDVAYIGPWNSSTSSQPMLAGGPK